MTMMRYFGLDPFPWAAFLATAPLGLLAGIVVKFLFWGSGRVGSSCTFGSAESARLWAPFSDCVT